MYNFNYDKKSDYRFDKEGYPIERKGDYKEERRSFNSNKTDVKQACVDFLIRKDNGFLYDIDNEVKDTETDKFIWIDVKMDFDGSWAIMLNDEVITKYNVRSLAGYFR